MRRATDLLYWQFEMKYQLKLKYSNWTGDRNGASQLYNMFVV